MTNEVRELAINNYKYYLDKFFDYFNKFLDSSSEQDLVCAQIYQEESEHWLSIAFSDQAYCSYGYHYWHIQEVIMNYEFANQMYDKAVDNVSYYADQVKVCKSNDIDWFIDELKYWREQAECWKQFQQLYINIIKEPAEVAGSFLKTACHWQQSAML